MTIRYRSIAFRLTLLYSAVALLTLLTVAAVLYWAVVNSVTQDDQRFLSEKIHVLRSMLEQRPSDKSLLEEEVKWETGVLPHARYYVRISDRQGQVIQATPGFDRSGINEANFPNPADLDTTIAPVRRQIAHGRSYMLTAAIARLGPGGADSRVLQLALDVSHEDIIFAEFRRIAWLVVIAGLVLSALLGGLVARRGLRPIRAMADAAARTSASRLQHQLDNDQWPAELQPLVTEFNGMLQRLDEAFSRISGFSADLAHELRTPLNNLMGEAEVTLSRARSEDEYRDTLGSILEECQRLSRMTDSLLFLARSDNPAGQLQREWFSARDELLTIADFYDAVAEEAGVTLTVQGKADVFADRELFRRAVTNLVSNAIRHSPVNSRVCLRLKPSVNAMELWVEDAGSGVAPEAQAQLFERFFRAEADRRNASSGGSGLGLAIVKSIMNLHQGSVSLTSQPGEGTMVRLWFPGRDLPDKG